MRDLCFTYYKTPFEQYGVTHTASWSEWVEAFSQHQLRGIPADTSNKKALDKAKMGPALLLGEVSEGDPRAKAHVRRVNALSLDLDSSPEAQVLAVLGALEPFEYYCWTTHKHGSEIAKGIPRLRIILPLAEPIEPADHASAWHGLNKLVGGANDPSTKDIARLNFLPSTFDLSVAETIHNPTNRWLALEDLPDVELSAEHSTVFNQLQNEKVAASIRAKIKRAEVGDDKPALNALAKGEPFADEGERHTRVLKLTYWIAEKSEHLSQGVIELLFASSLAKMGVGGPTMNEVWAAYEGAVAKIANSRKEKVQQLQLDGTKENQPYTEADYERIAKANGWEPEQLDEKWVIQRDGSAWFLSETGDYAGPYGRDDLAMAVKEHLSRTGARLIDLTKSGYRYRPAQDVIRENGSLLNSVVSDLTIQRTYFDLRTKILHEAILPIRKLEPEFDSVFDEWLKLAGGQHYMKLVDWLSCVADLNKILCAIYFHGQKSSGKTLFAYGVAKLWTEGPPADIETAVISDFNEELARCPIILADEQVPRKQHSTVTATLRALLSTTSRTLKRKYRAPSEIRGAVRLILAANNEFLLNSNDVSSSNDLEAIAERFLYIDIPARATDFLAELPRTKREQLAQEGIARHALWLKENHEIENPGKRFWVEGDVSEMHRLLMTGSFWNSMVCEWLTKFLLNPSTFESLANGLIRRENGELLVNDQALVDNWDLYIKTREEPKTAKIGAALRAISKTTRRRQLRFNGRQIRYRLIDIDHLIAWADRYNIGDTQTILTAVKDPSVGSGKIIYTSPTYSKTN